MKIEKLSSFKTIRLEKKWSQDQVAELSGLNTRTIQRIEKGEAASQDSIKALNLLFEVDFVNDNSAEIIAQTKKEEAYAQDLIGLYKLIGAGVLSLIYPFIHAVNSGEWTSVIWIAASWFVIYFVYYINNFELFGENWKQRIIDKKFKRKN